AFEAFEAATDQVFTRLGQNLYRDVVGNAAGPHEARDEIELRLACAGEADLDLLQAEFDEQVEETILLRRIHGIDDRLIAVAQVGRKPARRRGDGAGRPLPVGQGD